TVAEVPGAGHSSIVITRARIPGEQDRFLDPRSKTGFVFDHLSIFITRFSLVWVSLNCFFHLHRSVGSLRSTSL
ncbi:hypothetical protein BC826DRAFT_1041423, partial [Russula brevipes]